MAEAVAQKAFGAGLPTSPKPPTEGLPGTGILFVGSCLKPFARRAAMALSP